MSDAPPQARRTRNVIGSIAEGITFALFIGTLTSKLPFVIAIAAIWTITALALPIPRYGLPSRWASWLCSAYLGG